MNLKSLSFEKKNKIVIIAILVFITASLFKWFYKEDTGGKTFSFLVWLLACYFAYKNLYQKVWWEISRGVLIGFASYQLVLILFLTHRALTSLQEWDFLCFYMQGLLGTNHLAFYDPHSFDLILTKFNPPVPIGQEFKAEILNVGLLSPPITMLYFAPIASLDYHSSQLISSILIIVFIFLNTYLANNLIPKERRSIYSFLFVFIILMLIPGSISTIGYNQTNFFILFCLLIMLHFNNKPASGIFLALSMIFKPITGLLILYFVFNKKWKPVFYFILTGCLLLFLCISIWGLPNILSFFTSPPTLRLPQTLYIQSINQSLLALLNRNLASYSIDSTYIKMMFFTIAGIMIFISIIISKKLHDKNQILAFFPLILCMLMIYPSSLNHYMVYLFPMFIYFIFLKHEESNLWVIAISAMYFIYSETFFTYFVLWILMIYIVVYPSYISRELKVDTDYNLQNI